MKLTLIFDADDTLWETEIYYEQSIARFGELMATQGFDREEAERLVDAVEHERVPAVGYGPKEFGRNLGIACERLCERYGRSVGDEVAQAVQEIGRIVLEHPITLLDGVAETLPWLKERFCLLVLTKGDDAVQRDKLARSGLSHFFEGVHVVAEKDGAVLRELVDAYGLRPDETWMVGNSPRSDINPALEAGIGAIHIPHSHTWGFEQEEVSDPAGVAVLRSFAELADLFADG